MALFAGFELKEFDAASLSENFQDMGIPTVDACYYAVFSNESNVAVYITIDGVNNTIRLSPGQILPLFSYSYHNPYTNAAYVFKKRTQIQIKQVTAPGTGTITVNILTAR